MVESNLFANGVSCVIDFKRQECFLFPLDQEMADCLIVCKLLSLEMYAVIFDIHEHLLLHVSNPVAPYLTVFVSEP